MTITQLTLKNFRNYPELRLAADSGFIILSGENGAGKTNILEAISLLAPGRGLRRAPLTDIARESGTGEFAVSAEVGGVQLGTGTSADQTERRKTRINGAAAPTNELAEWLSILWLTPAMDRLFIEGASGRRNFLDRLVTALEPHHAKNFSRYDAARRERNRLLSDDVTPDPNWLDGLDEQLVQFGSAVADARFRLVGALNERFADDHGKQSDGLFATARIALDDQELRSEQALQDALRNSRQADIAAARTLCGPHRADMRVFHRSKDQAAEKCSTGEQKALLFSIILGHADLIAEKRGERPVLLLDEVAAHLDPSRRAALFEILAGKGGQVWMTGTEAELFRDVPDGSVHYSVADGTVERR